MHREQFKVFLLTVSIMLITASGFSMDIQTLKKMIKDRENTSQKEVNDIKIDQEIVMYVANNKGAKSLQTIYRKQGRTRTETIGINPLATITGKGNSETTKIVYINDGKNTWLITREGKTKLSLSGNLTNGASLIENIPENKSTVNNDNLDGKPCFLVNSVFGKNNIAVNIWLDKDTYNILQISDASSNTITKFKDFKKIFKDYEIAFKNESYANGNLLAIMTVKNYQLNKGLADSLFSVEGIKDAEKISIPGIDSNSMNDFMKNFKQKK